MFSDTFDFFVYAIVGIPGAIISLILMIVGIVRRTAGISLIGAVVSLGFCYFASAYTVTFGAHTFDIDYSSVYYGLTFLVLAGGNFLSAFGVWKRFYLIAAFSITPFVVAFLLLGGFAIHELI